MGELHPLTNHDIIKQLELALHIICFKNIYSNDENWFKYDSSGTYYWRKDYGNGLGDKRFLDGFHSRKEKFVDASYATWVGKWLELGKQCCVAHEN